MKAKRASGSEPTRVEDVHEQLRTAIIAGDFRPNERLIEAELAERLGVSRTPIRESMQRLMGDGLVARRRRGWIVHEHTHDEMREIYEVRAGLEGMATRFAAQRASDDELKMLAAVHREAADLKIADLRERLVELNEAFHQAVIGTCGNKRLQCLIQQTREHYFNYRIARAYSDEEIAASIVGQELIVRALLARDEDEAERVARAHVEEALAVLLSKFH